MFIYYDYSADLGRESLKYRRRMAKTSKLETKQAWNWNADGSAECASSSWESILDAYDEYKNNKDW